MLPATASAIIDLAGQALATAALPAHYARGAGVEGSSLGYARQCASLIEVGAKQASRAVPNPLITATYQDAAGCVFI